MTDASSFALAVIPLAPLLGCVVAFICQRLYPQNDRRWAVVLVGSGVLSLLATLFLLLLVDQAEGTPIAHLELYRWATIAGSLPIDVSFSLQIDKLSASLLLLVTFVATMILIAESSRLSDNSLNFFAKALFSLFAMTMLLMATNFVQLFFFWSLLAWGHYLPERSRAETLREATSIHKILLVMLGTDLMLAIGILLIWSNFGSLEISRVLSDSESFQTIAEENPAMLTVICLCLFAAAAGRCAQFPFLGWMDDTAGSSSSTNALLQTVTAMPAAVFLIVLSSPLFAAAAEARLMMAVVGALSLLFAGFIAVSQSDMKRALGYTTAGRMGMMFLGLGTGVAAGIDAALLLLFAHCLATAAMFVLDSDAGSGEAKQLQRPSRFLSGLRLICIVVLCTGFWGHYAILTSVNETVVRSTAGEFVGVLATNAFEPSQVNLLRITVWLATIGMVLSAFALFRMFFLTRLAERIETPLADANRSSLHPRPLISALLLSTFAAITFPAFTRLYQNSAVDPFAFDVLTSGFVLLLVLLSAVFAWMFYARPNQQSKRLAVALEPFERLSRNRLYLDDLFSLFLILPIRGLAQLCRFFDWFLIDGVIVSLPLRILNVSSQATGTTRNGLVQFYALSLMLAVAVLLTLIVWFQR